MVLGKKKQYSINFHKKFNFLKFLRFLTNVFKEGGKTKKYVCEKLTKIVPSVGPIPQLQIFV